MQLLPITRALVGMGAALLEQALITSLFPQIGILTGFGFVRLPLSLLAFYAGVRWAKISSTLSHF